MYVASRRHSTELIFLKLRSLRPKEAKLYIVCTVRRSQSKHTASPRRAPPAAIAANTIAARHQRASDDQNAHLNDWRSVLPCWETSRLYVYLLPSSLLWTWSTVSNELLSFKKIVLWNDVTYIDIYYTRHFKKLFLKNIYYIICIWTGARMFSDTCVQEDLFCISI